MNLEQWEQSVLKNYLRNHHLAESEKELIFNFIKNHSGIKLDRCAVPQVLVKAQSWSKREEKRQQELKESGATEEVYVFPTGLRFVRLLDQAAKVWEGKHMRHCVGGEDYQNHNGIFSLRDRDNVPHVTLELNGKWVEQINGKCNREIAPKYEKYLIKFLQDQKLSLYSTELSERFNYIELSDEEAFFRRNCFETPKEYISETVMFGPRSMEAETVKAGSILADFIKNYPGYAKVYREELSFSQLFKFYMHKGNLEEQRRMLNSVQRMSVSFLTWMIKKAVKTGKHESIDLLISFLPKGIETESIVDAIIESKNLQLLEKILTMNSSEAEMNYFLKRVLTTSVYYWREDVFDWVLTKKEIPVQVSHVLDALRNENRDDLSFFKKILELYLKNAPDAMERMDRIIISSLRYPQHFEILKEYDLHLTTDENKQRSYLMKSLSLADFEKIKFFTSIGYKLDFELDSYLTVAVKKANLELVKFLVSLGAKVSKHDFASLSEASRRGNKEILDYLIQQLVKEHNVV